MSDNLSDRSARGPSAWLRRWKSFRDIEWINLMMPMTIFVLFCALVGIWYALPTSKMVSEPAIDIFETALDEAIDKNKGDFHLWYKSNVVIQCTLIFTALLATVFASLTTKENTERVKKWSVVLTAITATLASVQSTFHVRENIETFIRTNSDLALLEMDYVFERAPLDNDLRKYNELKTKSSEADLDPDLQKKLIELRHKFMPRWMAIQTDQMRAWTNAGSQPMAPQSGNGYFR
jgi:hypothetical protein